MASEIYTQLTEGWKVVTTFEEPEDHHVISRNLARVSFWGALAPISTASVSFIFSRFLLQEGFCKTVASHVFKASLTSSLIFAAVGASCIYNIVNSPYAETSNERVFLFAKCSASLGLVGAAAAWASKFITPNTLVSSLAKHSFFPLIGLSAVGSTLWIFYNKQKSMYQSLR